MYNRYIPQSDGSYRKNRIPEQRPQCPAPPPPRPPEPQPEPNCPSRGGNAGSFLRNLLPRDFDTGDLLVILLLLLMAEQNEDDKNTALLTLALYFFL